MSPSGRPELNFSCIDHMHTHSYTRSYKNEAPDDASAGLQTAPTGKSIKEQQHCMPRQCVDSLDFGGP